MKIYCKILLILALILLLIILFASCDEPQEVTPLEYEVLSVQSYLSTDTNGWGGITRQNIVYQITYLDCDSVKVLTEFDSEYNYYHHLNIGDTDKLVVNGSHYYLYLTRETYNKLTERAGS